MAIRKEIISRGLVAFAIGLITGALTVVGQKHLPGSLNSLANSGAVWLVPAFFVAMTAQTKVSSILFCMETLIVCVVSYYWAESIVNQHSFVVGGYYFYLWLTCAVVFGAIFGFGAFLHKQINVRYNWGAGLLPAVFLSEGLSQVIHLSDYAHMIPAIIGRILIGLILYGIINRKDAFNKKPLVSFGVLSALGLIGFEVLYRLTT